MKLLDESRKENLQRIHIIFLEGTSEGIPIKFLVESQKEQLEESRKDLLEETSGGIPKRTAEKLPEGNPRRMAE